MMIPSPRDITPHTPVPVLRQMVRRTYWLQTWTCVFLALILALIGPHISDMVTVWQVIWIVLFALNGSASYALFNAAANLRTALHELIEEKLGLEK